MEAHSFFLHNKPGCPTHFPRNDNSPSMIDLCFSSGTITNNILAHEIRPESTSDHATCMIYLNLTPPKATLKRTWYRADWILFQKTVTGSGLDLSNINITEEALRAATNITKIINDATNAAIP
jgi:hypothetical protein